MLAPSKVNKENFRLLDLSSGEESDDLQLEIIPSRKKKITRRERNRGSAPQVSEPNFGAEVQCALRWAVRGTLLLWLFMLTWICAALYDQVSTMQAGFLQVSRSNKAVDDVLQACHTTAKELRVNTSVLTARLDELKYNYTLLASRVDKATEELSAVSEQLSAAPKLADTPRTIADLQRLVADLGSQISGVDSSIQSNNRQARLAVTGVEEVKTLLHQLETRTNNTIDTVTANIKRDDDLRSDIATLNSTFTAKVEALQNMIQEISKPISTAMPVSSTPVILTSSRTASTNATSANTTTTIPPVKPAVLQSEKSP